MGHPIWLINEYIHTYGSGKYLASGSDDNTVRIWDVSTQQQVAELRGHTDHVTSVAFDGSGKYLASGEVAEG